VTLSPGSRLVFYSDGITEASNQAEEEYGLDRLSRHVSSRDASAITVVDDVRAFANGTGVRDDATVVFVGVAN
jgi:sigma-B regulation protein RsbU (phosphoserine phosphatase)